MGARTARDGRTRAHLRDRARAVPGRAGVGMAGGLLALALGLSGCAGGTPDGGVLDEQEGATPAAASTPGDGGEQDVAGDLVLSSPDVGVDGRVPAWGTGDYRGYCEGENRSPALSWSGVPSGTEGFALVMVDDAGSGYVHWVVSGIPGSATGLEQAAEGRVGTGVVGTSLAGAGTYLGPCAAGHEYRYVLYALDEGWTGTAGTSMSTLLAEVEDHVLASAELRVSPSPEGS